MKRFLSVILVLVMILTITLPLPAGAATSLPDSIYLYPTMGGETCTLVSAAMMHRARMYLSGDTTWSSITEYSIYDIAWINGTGLRWGWTFNTNGNSMTVSNTSVSGISVASLKALLNAHPEGIVLFSGSLKHAVFLTDYDGDTFYCADPYGGSYSGRRLSLADSYLGRLAGGSQADVLNKVTAYWYISSYNFTNSIGSSAMLGETFTAPIHIKNHWIPIENNYTDGINSPIQINLETGYANQLWYFERQTDGTYIIFSCYDGSCIEVASDGTIRTAKWTGSDAQRWYVHNRENGEFLLETKSKSGYVLELPNNDPTFGTVPTIAPYHGGESQIWAIYLGQECVLAGPEISVEPGTSTTPTKFTWKHSYGAGYYYLKIWQNEAWVGDPYTSEYTVTPGCSVILPAGTYQAYVDACHYYGYDMGNLVTFTVEPSSCEHDFSPWITITAASCTSDGLERKTCRNSCGTTEDRTIPATGHDYHASVQPATCIATKIVTYTCGNCGDDYMVQEEMEYSDWSETYPDILNEKAVEVKTQYRYRDRASEWSEPVTGTVDYVASWPSGFDTSLSHYAQYNNTPKTAYENETEKVQIVSNDVVGYLYYHWCRNYAYGPINRMISDCYTDTYWMPHVFYSTSGAPDYDSEGSYGEGAKYFYNADCCRDSWWYLQIPVYRQTYTTQTKIQSTDGWTDWSDWSDAEVAGSDNRQVETRNLYRYVTNLGNHVYSSSTDTTCEICTHFRVDDGEGTIRLPGDYDKDDHVDRADVTYLLWHTLFPARYPISINGDLNRDGSVTEADAVCLLWHTLFPELYPL